MKVELVKKIIGLLLDCQDESLLDFVWRLLLKSSLT